MAIGCGKGIYNEYKSGNKQGWESQCDQAMVAHGEGRADRNEDLFCSDKEARPW